MNNTLVIVCLTAFVAGVGGLLESAAERIKTSHTARVDSVLELR